MRHERLIRSFLAIAICLVFALAWSTAGMVR